MTSTLETRAKHTTHLLMGLFLLVAISVVSWSFPLQHQIPQKIELKLPPQPNRSIQNNERVKSKFEQMSPQERELWMKKSRNTIQRFERVTVFVLGALFLAFLTSFALFLIHNSPNKRLKKAAANSDNGVS